LASNPDELSETFQKTFGYQFQIKELSEYSVGKREFWSGFSCISCPIRIRTRESRENMLRKPIWNQHDRRKRTEITQFYNLVLTLTAKYSTNHRLKIYFDQLLKKESNMEEAGWLKVHTLWK